jgi:hypothetical protein
MVENSDYYIVCDSWTKCGQQTRKIQVFYFLLFLCFAEERRYIYKSKVYGAQAFIMESLD